MGTKPMYAHELSILTYCRIFSYSTVLLSVTLQDKPFALLCLKRSSH